MLKWSSIGALVPPQGDAKAQQSDAQTLTPGASWMQKLRSRRCKGRIDNIIWSLRRSAKISLT